MSQTTSGCEVCGVRAEQRTCEDCGAVAVVIDCGHHAQPAEIASSKHDAAVVVCRACEEASDDEAEAAKAPSVDRVAINAALLVEVRRVLHPRLDAERYALGMVEEAVRQAETGDVSIEIRSIDTSSGRPETVTIDAEAVRS